MVNYGMLKQILIVIGVSLVPVSPSYALCSYKGVLYAKTTVAQEYVDATWVVRARVISADYHWSEDGESWSSYNLRPLENFKGKLPKQFTVFTERNSGGFYMDAGGASPDLGAEYLLFLQPMPSSKSSPLAARGSLIVNYSCGQSKRWKELVSTDVKLLRAKSKHR